MITEMMSRSNSQEEAESCWGQEVTECERNWPGRSGPSAVIEKENDEAEERHCPESTSGLTEGMKVKWNMALKVGKHPHRHVFRTLIIPSDSSELSGRAHLRRPELGVIYATALISPSFLSIPSNWACSVFKHRDSLFSVFTLDEGNIH